MKISTRLLRWYDRYGRDLPWRKTKDPYRVLVSEVMLQQTQVDRVKGFYRAWLKVFPTWKKLAQAGNADVIRLWAGLGYNRRALALRDIAREVVKSGEPKTEEEWLKLRGIGPYTAAAVSALAQGKKTLPVDTNVRRVLGRLLLGKPYPTMDDDATIRLNGSDILDTPRSADVVQALFDLASGVCKKTPNCASCPFAKTCRAGALFLSGQAGEKERLTPVAREKIREGKRYPDRIYRGRILRLVRESGAGVRILQVGMAIDERFDPIADSVWVEAMIGRLVKDGLISRKGTLLTLP